MTTNTPTSKPNLTKAGVSFLKRLVFEEGSLEADNRRDEDRTPVVGEVTVVVLDVEGKPAGQTRVFVRDLSKNGCGLWSRCRFADGTRVVLHFPACNGQPPLARAAIIRHCRGQDGAGFAIGCRFLADATTPKA